ncbi:YjgF-like protein [Sarocladium strictum]
MSARFINIPGALAKAGETLGVSQAVSIPANARIVVTSGQVGFREDLSISENLGEQLDQILQNAQRVLVASGVNDGLKSVYQITIYMLELSDELVVEWKRAKARFMGDVRPVETGVAVPALYGGAKMEMTFYAIAGPDQKL